jgi:asparagine synthetase B (glutamine-hydrolysing)
MIINFKGSNLGGATRMSSRADEVKEILKQYPQYQETLFCRGYLVTSRALENLNTYPFYNQWLKTSCGKLNNGTEINIYYHKWQNCCTYEENGISVTLIGHAYNPFDMKYQEIEIIKDCLNVYNQGREAFFEKVSELTGIHLILLNDKDRLIFVQDCAGMKSCYFGKVNDDIYTTSHPQLVGDICNLRMDSFIEKLVKLRCYNIGNRHLPGNLTPFKELKRLGGNTYTEYTGEFKIKRFYPVKPHDEIKNQEQFDETIERIFNIMHRNIELTTYKWARPAISLSGGMDSKTTLSCANGLYDKFSFFSFHCKPQEIVDATAAHKICESIGLDHTIYPIPETNNEIKDFHVLKKVIDHNTAYVKNTADHEIRKMIYLYLLNAHDVELKSWVSEIGRCSLERRYGIKMPHYLSARHYSIFQTRFLFSPLMLNRTENYYMTYTRFVGHTVVR